MKAEDSKGTWFEKLGSLRDLYSGLSGRLFVFTVLFVLLAEIIVFVPSLGTFLQSWLSNRVTAAQIAALVYDDARVRDGDRESTEKALARTEVDAIVLNRGDMWELLYSSANARARDMTIDLNRHGILYGTWKALSAMTAGNGRMIYVIGARLDSGESVEILMPEAPLKAALWGFTFNISLLSLLIAGITAGLVFAVVYHDLVRPIRNIINSMSHFQEQPDDATRIIRPRPGGGELGQAKFALQSMQTDVFRALQQKSRLAALGTAISKINHDLRNILASAQLVTDRLAASEDPAVRRQASKLVQSIDRAVALCTQTLRFGRAEEAPPRLRSVRLASICEDVRDALDWPDSGRISWACHVPEDLEIITDSDHMFRILLNLTRNSLQAMETRGSKKKGGRISIRASVYMPEPEEQVPVSCHIEVEDTGPGIPEATRDNLFKAFVSSARSGGTGLGLAISHELVAAQGGSLELVRTGDNGTVFRIVVPFPENGENFDDGDNAA